MYTVQQYFFSTVTPAKKSRPNPFSKKKEPARTTTSGLDALEADLVASRPPRPPTPPPPMPPPPTFRQPTLRFPVGDGSRAAPPKLAAHQQEGTRAKFTTLDKMIISNMIAEQGLKIWHTASLDWWTSTAAIVYPLIASVIKRHGAQSVMIKFGRMKTAQKKPTMAKDFFLD